MRRRGDGWIVVLTGRPWFELVSFFVGSRMSQGGYLRLDLEEGVCMLHGCGVLGY
jgi:hypothetical protein